MTPAVAAVTPARLPDVVLAGRFEPGQAGRYAHLPFQVPDGLRQLHVHYEYSERIPSDPGHAGGNTLDIGLFDERGIVAGGPGFRGWSGSERASFTIAENWATPPYRPGPLGPGTWHVLLGPYKIGTRGLDYRVEVWFDPGLPPDEPGLAPMRPASVALPVAAEPGWVRGDLHCHTLHSDGDSWLVEVLAAAAAIGLDFLGVTDHNSAIRPSLPAGEAGLPVLLPGIEVTTYAGHWNAWGGDGWFDFRQPTAAGIEEAIGVAVAAGAFVSVNHPKPFGPTWLFPEVRGHHAIEVWNGPWERLNALALAAWDQRLRQGDHLVAVGGSDTHRLRDAGSGGLAPARLGQPTTWIQIDGPLTAAALLAGLQAGSCFVSASPAGPQLYLSLVAAGLRARVVGGRGAALLLCSDAGCVASAAILSDDWREEFPWPAGARYVRSQIADPFGDLIAASNPIWHDRLAR